MKKMTLAAGAVAITLAGSAVAGDMYSADLNIDSVDSGLLADHVFSLPAIDSIDSVKLELAHTWGGDWEIQLMHNDSGATFDLMFDEVDQSGSGNFDMGLAAGSGALGNVAPYTFVESGGLSVYDDTSGVAPAGTYDASSWVAGGFAAGDWTLHIFDDAGGDVASVGNVMVMYTVPAPGALALLGLAGFAGRRRRG